jgi:DNA-directed RNA polymerase specialized sigma24 family protein
MNKYRIDAGDDVSFLQETTAEQGQGDAYLVERALAGEREAFQSLLQRYYPGLLRLCQRWLASPRDSEDVVAARMKSWPRPALIGTRDTWARDPRQFLTVCTTQSIIWPHR